MPPSPSPPGSVRSAAERANAAIRLLWQRARSERRPLSEAELVEYRRLRGEYVRAARAEVVKAA